MAKFHDFPWYFMIFMAKHWASSSSLWILSSLPQAAPCQWRLSVGNPVGGLSVRIWFMAIKNPLNEWGRWGKWWSAHGFWMIWDQFPVVWRSALELWVSIFPYIPHQMWSQTATNHMIIHGYGSIPIHTIFRGMNIHLPAILMFTRGIGFWPIPTWQYEFRSF